MSYPDGTKWTLERNPNGTGFYVRDKGLTIDNNQVVLRFLTASMALAEENPIVCSRIESDFCAMMSNFLSHNRDTRSREFEVAVAPAGFRGNNLMIRAYIFDVEKEQLLWVKPVKVSDQRNIGKAGFHVVRAGDLSTSRLVHF